MTALPRGSTVRRDAGLSLAVLLADVVGVSPGNSQEVRIAGVRRTGQS